MLLSHMQCRISAPEWKERGGQAASRSRGYKLCRLSLSALHMVLLGLRSYDGPSGKTMTSGLLLEFKAAVHYLVVAVAHQPAHIPVAYNMSPCVKLASLAKTSRAFL